MLIGHFQSRPVGKKAHRVDIAQVFDFFDKGYYIPARPAAKAIK
jgi:hypothetical protein